MKRTYLIDSENINDIWVELLHCLEEKDEILVFYTDKSAHMGYERIIKLMEQKRGSVRWIRCFEGQNALDFQLVTELGSRISQEPKREYTIVSNDTGYDAVVRYWQQKDCRVRRMKGVECEALVGTGKNGATEVIRVEEPVKEAVHVNRQVQETKQAVQETRQMMQETRQQAQEQATRQAAQATRQAAQATRQAAQATRQAAQESRQVAQESRRAPAHKKVRSPKLAPIFETTDCTDNADEVEHTEHAEYTEQTAYIEAAEIADPPAPAVERDVRFETVDTWRDELLQVFRGLGSQEAREDMEFLLELCKTVKLSNMSLMHNVLEYHFGQEAGNAIYHFIKENPGCRGELSAGYSNNKKQRERQYLSLILKRNHMVAEDGDEEAILKILGGIPRKNLNSIHTALIKKFGAEEGGNCYAVLRNHVKIIRGL